MFEGTQGIETTWASAGRFEPAMNEADRKARYDRWLDAVARARSER